MGEPITTIPPFSNPQRLPACATSCGALHNANGGCVPPGGPEGSAEQYTACFCSHAEVTAFSTASLGICDDACGAGGAELGSIANWFQDICSVDGDGGGDGGNGDGGGGGDSTTTATNGGDSEGDSSGSDGSDGGGGGDWLSGHWQWVIMLVILVVGIAGIWVGACIWRRRYLKRKDRQSFISQKHSGSIRNPSWGPTPAGIDRSAPTPDIYEFDSRGGSGFAAGSASHEEGSKKSRKWLVNERT